MNTSAPLVGRAPAQSGFVTAVAWIWISMSGLSMLVALMQTILFRTLLPGPNFERVVAEAGATQDPQAQFAASMFDWFPWITGLMFLVSAVTLVASIGLLRRLNWARLLFIALLVLSIVWQVAGLALQQTIFSMLPAVPPEAGAPPVEQFLHVMRVAGVVLTLAFAVLFGWIIKRLVSPAVVAEFK